MSPNPAEGLKTRLRSFLVFVRPKLLHLQTDGARVVQLRRIADIRINQFAVKKPDVNAADVGKLLAADPTKKPFAALAIEEKLIHPQDAAVRLVQQSEEMGYCIELSILADILPVENFRAFLREFATSNPLGVPPASPPIEKAAPVPSQAPLPERIQLLLGKANDLWSMPEATLALTQKLSAPDPKMEEVVHDIQRDPGLSAQILRVVNSAFYGLSRRISSIQRAVVTLGYRATKQIVTIASVIVKLGQQHPEVKFDLKDFWGHSLWVAHAAQSIARQTRGGDPEEHFSAGLMHDIGKLVEYQHLRHAMREILEGVARGGRYEEMERIVLGVNHAAIGACVCERWNFPPAIVEAVRRHLDPPASLEDQPLPRASLTVCALCRISRTTIPPEEIERWCQMLKITTAQIDMAKSEATSASLGSLRDVFLSA